MLGELLPLLHFNLLNFGLAAAVFAGLAVVLGKFAWGPITKALDERDATIRKNWDESEANRKKTEEIKEARQKALEALREERLSVLGEARVRAEKDAEEIIRNARLEAKRIIDQAQKEMEYTRIAEMGHIRDSVVAVGVDLAKKLLRREINPKLGNELLEESLAELGKAWPVPR